MGCNCGRARRRLKELVKQSQPPLSSSPVVPVQVKTRRQLRIEARSKRVAARNAAILAARAKQEALQKNFGGQ